MKQVKPIRALCESAILLALAIVLSYVKFFQLPFDGRSPWHPCFPFA